MKRKDREITNINEKLDIVAKCKICRIGLSKDAQPYIIPLNYGYSYNNGELILYFHGANAGKKIDIIQKNNNACFEIDCDAKLVEGEKPCDYSYEFRSVIGFGKIILLDAIDEKINGLNNLMNHQTGKNVKYNFNESELNNVIVFKMLVEEFTGKQKNTIVY